jgi:hypothetical protein
MNKLPLDSAHPPELIAQAVVLLHGNFVKLDDMLFEQHGLGPRYAQVITNTDAPHRSLSYAYWNLPGTSYDLITRLDNPQDLGSFDDLVCAGQLVPQLMNIFQRRSSLNPAPQQLALALIKAKEQAFQAGDELGAHRLVKWARTYERRAHWIATNRQQAFMKATIDWQALGL